MDKSPSSPGVSARSASSRRVLQCAPTRWFKGRDPRGQRQAVNRACCALAAGLALLFALPQATHALSTAFTYQGQLLFNGNPFTGICPDLEFSLWDAPGSGSPPSGGNRIGQTFVVPDTMVTNGVFTVQIDFGAPAFDGNDRWLQIGVNCAGPATILSPRQQLTATPYALYAASASSAGDVTCSGCVSTGDLANGAVTATKIASGAIQQSNLAFTPGSMTSITAGTGLTGGTITTSGTIGANIGTTAGTVATGDHTHASPYWGLSGNAGTMAGTNYLGTTDYQALELRVNGARAFRIEPGTSPSLSAGWTGNTIELGAVGAVIAGGGSPDLGGGPAANAVTDNYGTVSGGVSNIAGNLNGDVTDVPFATVGGGLGNLAAGNSATVGGTANYATALYASVAGGYTNYATGIGTTVGGGMYNQASGEGSTIGGGGSFSDSAGGNRVYDDYDTIGGGGANRAGSDDADGTNAAYATVGGGHSNSAEYKGATVGGGENNSAGYNYNTISGGRNNDTYYGFATVGGGDANSASGPWATVGGGNKNRTGGDYFSPTIGGGSENFTGAAYATIPGGYRAAASHFGEFAYASGTFTSTGDAQTSVYVLRNSTTDATTRELFLDGFNQRITIASNRTLAFEALVVARSLLGASAGYRVRGVVSNVGGGTSMVGATGDVLGEDPLAAAWNAVAEADDFNDALVFRVSGAPSTAVRWVATVRTAEVAW